MAGNVTACGDFSASTDTRFDITANISTSITTGSCLKFPNGSVVYLNGSVITGFNQGDPTVGIEMGNDGFVWGPGVIRRFGTGIKAGHDVAIENVMIGPVHIGIQDGDSYKIKEVRIRNCVTSGGNDIGMLLGQGGFVESSIVRDCATGVITEKNNKIWNLVVSKHLITGLQIGLKDAGSGVAGAGGAGAGGTIVAGSGAGNAVSRTVISSPKSTSTVGLDYRGCGNPSTPAQGGGCQDGSNSVQDHCATGVAGCPTSALNILITSSSTNAVITDGATNCGGKIVPHAIASDLITSDC